MMFLLATEEQKEQIEGLYNNRSEIQFLQHEGQWITPTTNLTNPDFDSVMDILNSLPIIDITIQSNIP